MFLIKKKKIIAVILFCISYLYQCYFYLQLEFLIAVL